MVEQRFYAMAKDFGGFLIKTSDVKGLMFLEDAIQPYFTFPDLRSAFSFAIKVLYNPGLSDTVSALGGTIGFGMSVVGGIAADDKQDYQIEYNGERVNLAHRAMTFAHKWHIWIVGEEGQVDEIKTIRVYICMHVLGSHCASLHTHYSYSAVDVFVLSEFDWCHMLRYDTRTPTCMYTD